MGYQIVATKGTADYLKLNGIDAELIKKVKDGSPHCVEAIESGRINIVINTTFVPILNFYKLNYVLKR